jgi:hypothetical protein
LIAGVAHVDSARPHQRGRIQQPGRPISRLAIDPRPGIVADAGCSGRQRHRRACARGDPHSAIEPHRSEHHGERSPLRCDLEDPYIALRVIEQITNVI